MVVLIAVTVMVVTSVGGTMLLVLHEVQIYQTCLIAVRQPRLVGCPATGAKEKCHKLGSLSKPDSQMLVGSNVALITT
jgi:hypothetical protein